MTELAFYSVYCSLYRLVQLPFILSCLLSLGQFKNVNIGSIGSIMSLAYGFYHGMLQTDFPFSFFFCFSPWIPYFWFNVDILIVNYFDSVINL